MGRTYRHIYMMIREYMKLLVVALSLLLGSSASAYDHVSCMTAIDTAGGQTVSMSIDHMGHTGHDHGARVSSDQDATDHKPMDCVQHACSVFAFTETGQRPFALAVHIEKSRLQHFVVTALSRPESIYRPPSV